MVMTLPSLPPENGASAILAERPLDLDIPVIVVRDTNGRWRYSRMRFMAIQLKSYA